MISVVIPLYNKEKQIANTLQTVLHQSYQNFEVVIVNDGSTDKSVDVVEKMQDPRIFLFHQKNAGVSAARNKGIELARGEFIALLDADDEWHVDYLKSQINLIENYPECDVFATNYVFKNNNGVESHSVIKKIPFRGVDGILSNYFEVASCSHPPLCSSAIVVRKSAIVAIGGFPVGVKSGEDLLTWAKLAVSYKIAYTKRTLTTFIFDESIFNDDQKLRKPELDDYVGKHLKQLYLLNTSIVGLKAYVALWHKMRARIYLQKNCRYLSLKESFKSLYLKFSTKVCIFVLMAFLPQNLIRKLFNK